MLKFNYKGELSLNKKSILFLAKILNPVILIVYGIACLYIISLGKYGGIRKRLPIIIGCILIILIWILYCIYRKIKEDKVSKEAEYHSSTVKNRFKLYKIWLIIGGFIFLSTTYYTCINLYKSGSNFQGKLSWFIHDIKNKRQVSFIHNNIYEDNLDGIFKDIRHKVSLPDELFLSSNFSLKFNKKGIITSFDSYFYGKDNKGKTRSFLISYDEKKSNKIIIYLRGYVEDDFDKNKELQPMIDMAKAIPVKEKVLSWNEDSFGLSYRGVRSFGYNNEGVFYVGENEDITPAKSPREEIIGYTLSIYVPGKEKQITPLRFIDSTKMYVPQKEEDVKPSWDIGYNYNEGEETFFIDHLLGYQLQVADAALGSRFYSLFKTSDGGSTWNTINPDPFNGDTGVSAGITFINNDLGFIGLSHSGGSYGQLYRTDNGGHSYEKVEIPSIEVTLSNNEKYNPFDFPQMPYEVNDKLYLIVGQGQDGDYEGGTKAMYESLDKGNTWKYIQQKHKQ